MVGGFALALPSLEAEAKTYYYYIKATATCSTCSGKQDVVPLETTGQNFTSKSACEKLLPEFIRTFNKNELEVKARCVRTTRKTK